MLSTPWSSYAEVASASTFMATNIAVVAAEMPSILFVDFALSGLTFPLLSTVGRRLSAIHLATGFPPCRNIGLLGRPSLTRRSISLSGADSDIVSYETSNAGVTADLASGTGSGGYARGDSFTSIEGLIGSAFDDTLAGDGGDNYFDGGAVRTSSYDATV